jgi:hypothetical protein
MDNDTPAVTVLPEKPSESIFVWRFRFDGRIVKRLTTVDGDNTQTVGILGIETLSEGDSCFRIGATRVENGNLTHWYHSL